MTLPPRPLALLLMLCGLSAGSQAQVHNLLVNGGFEASSSATSTPPGWFNIGHEDGVITYAAFGTPAYEGRNYYDLGGYGDPAGPIGDGIGQSFATVVGGLYQLQFGLSAENAVGLEYLTVTAGTSIFNVALEPDGSGPFQRGFTTYTLRFTAASTLSTLAFVHSAGPGGSNDPMIDRVIVSEVPEPAPAGLMAAGALLLALRRRRSAA